jgi:hypothetical protein
MISMFRVTGRHALLLLSILLLAAVAGVGCGSGGGSDSSVSAGAVTDTGNSATTNATSETPPTKAAFIAEADAICKATDKEQAVRLALVSRAKPKGLKKPEQEQAVLGAGLPPIQREVEQLRALDPPSEDAAKVEAILKGIERAVDEAKADPASVLSTAGNPFNAVDKLAAEYGFKACANAL